MSWALQRPWAGLLIGAKSSPTQQERCREAPNPRSAITEFSGYRLVTRSPWPEARDGAQPLIL